MSWLGRLRDIFLERITAQQTIWSIAIYTGQSPLELSPADKVKNPVLTARHVRDVDALFVADPFMLCEDDRWYMFFEVYNKKCRRGEIGLATSMDGCKWDYEQIILKEDFHLSYPYVFKWHQHYFMIPETAQDYSIRLYKAVHFPSEWTLDRVLMRGPFRDSSILYKDDSFWLFTCPTPDSSKLSLYVSKKLAGPWTEHPKSPIVGANLHNARPAGRVLMYENQVIRYAQDCHTIYGSSVRAFQITTMTIDNYTENECAHNPILRGSGSGWNAHKMHNIDVVQLDSKKWVACVDGGRIQRVLRSRRY